MTDKFLIKNEIENNVYYDQCSIATLLHEAISCLGTVSSITPSFLFDLYNRTQNNVQTNTSTCWSPYNISQ